MDCAYHRDAPAVATCSSCKRALCEACAIHWQGQTICKHCLETENLKHAERPQRLGKSTALAGWFSLLPGLGQIYVGYYRSGFIHLLVVAGIITLLSNGVGAAEPFLSLFLSFFWMFNIFDAVRKARIYNRYIENGQTEPELPTDSPLVGGIVLLILGLYMTLAITFDLDLEFLESIWPVVVMGLGVYLLWRYWKTKHELEDRRQDRFADPLRPGREDGTLSSEAKSTGFDDA